MEMLVNEILEAADAAVNERWRDVGEATDETLARLRDLMERYHRMAGGAK